MNLIKYIYYFKAVHQRIRDNKCPHCDYTSSDADYVVAQTLNVDGGNWMS